VRQSYFALGELAPRRLIERLLNPYRYGGEVTLRDQPLRIEWTGRAERALAQRDRPLHVEMQLYFSCVVKKRVLFHESGGENGVPLEEKLLLAFHPVEAASCDPIEFARHYPQRRDMTSAAAGRMHPSVLRLDYRAGRWQGEFDV